MRQTAILLGVVLLTLAGCSGDIADTGGGTADASPSQDALIDASLHNDGSARGHPDADRDATRGATAITIEAIPPDVLA